MDALIERLQVLSLIPGRVRFHLRGWAGIPQEQIENGLRTLPGVERVRANPTTGNILLHFDSRITTAEALLGTAVTGRRALPSAQKLIDLGRMPETKPEPVPGPGTTKVVQAGMCALIGHLLIDSVFYAITFSQPFGLPLAGLGVLHLGFDVVVWAATLTLLLDGAAPAREFLCQSPTASRLRPTPH